MSKLFVPPLDSRWRLLFDWRFPTSFANRYGNQDFVKNVNCLVGLGDWPPYRDAPTQVGWQWTDALRDEWSAWLVSQIEGNPLAVFPKGTIIQFNRYHVSHSGEDEITLEMIISPEACLTPKKRGGKGKGKMRFYMSLAELNTLPELEEFTDVLG